MIISMQYGLAIWAPSGLDYCSGPAGACPAAAAARWASPGNLGADSVESLAVLHSSFKYTDCSWLMGGTWPA
jgi:hypothetical protein